MFYCTSAPETFWDPDLEPLSCWCSNILSSGSSEDGFRWNLWLGCPLLDPRGNWGLHCQVFEQHIEHRLAPPESYPTP